MLELLDNDPEMRARYDKLVNGGLSNAGSTSQTSAPPVQINPSGTK